MSNAGFSRGRRLFDPWKKHAQPPVNDGFYTTNAGMFFEFLVADLVDGNQYYWWSSKLMTFDDASNYYDSLHNFQVPNYPGGWFGEGFNRIQRPSHDNKGSYSDFLAWAAAH